MIVTVVQPTWAICRSIRSLNKMWRNGKRKPMLRARGMEKLIHPTIDGAELEKIWQSLKPFVA